MRKKGREERDGKFPPFLPSPPGRELHDPGGIHEEKEKRREEKTKKKEEKKEKKKDFFETP